MIKSQGFNPFNILPRDLMLQILLNTFTEEGKGSLEYILDYHKANKDFCGMLADEQNFEYILNSMPTEFNIELIRSLRQRKITNEEGRYRAGLALLFLKHLYEHVKPFPDDEFIHDRFDDYYTSLKYLQEYFVDYPMPMYIGAMVSFNIAKRLMITNPLLEEAKEKATLMYKVAVECIVRAHELEHPLARIFYTDMQSQCVRSDIHFEEYLTVDLPKLEDASLNDLVSLLFDEEKEINLQNFSDEEQTLLLVTWQKLIIENYYNAKDLFSFTYEKNKLINITEYFYQCYQINHFHRYILASNPLFVHVENKKCLTYLLEKFSVDSLVSLYQAFRIHHPKPDSVLLSTLLNMSLIELNESRTLISEILTLPQNEFSGWHVCFLEAYRDAVDDGSLKKVSAVQMKMILHYFMLVNLDEKIDSILDRDAAIVSLILHCADDQVHEIALAVLKQLTDFTRLEQFKTLYQKEIILKVIYEDALYLSAVKIESIADLNRVATTIVNAYVSTILPNLPESADLKVYEFMFRNKGLFRNYKNEIHEKIFEQV